MADVIEEDISLLIRLSSRIPSAFIPMVNVTDVLYQLKDSLILEIDFRNEAQAMLILLNSIKGLSVLLCLQFFQITRPGI